MKFLWKGKISTLDNYYDFLDACIYSNVQPTSALVFSLFTFLDVGIQIAVRAGSTLAPVFTAI